MDYPTPAEWKAKVRESIDDVLMDLNLRFEDYQHCRSKKADECRDRICMVANETLQHFMSGADICRWIELPRTTYYMSLRSWKRKYGEKAPENQCY